MDFKQIQELIRMVNKSNIAELSIREGDFRITIRSTDYMAPQTIRPEMYNPVSMPMAQQQSIPSANYSQPEAVTEQKESSKPSSGSDESKYVTIKSPMIGTFYRTPGPDKPTFVNVGDEIQPGTVVCIIEAMKLFNEIESDIKGKIVKVLVENATPVEYDQPLFLVDPS